MGTYCSVFGYDRRERQPEFTVNAGFVLLFLLTQVFQVAEPALYAKSHLPSPTQPLNVHPVPPNKQTNKNE